MIVFYDGVCGLCHFSVNWLLDRDQKDLLKFAPLQGETAKQKLSLNEAYLDSIVLLTDNKTLKGYDAIKEIIQNLNHPLRYLLMVTPPPIGRVLYKIISKTRYRLFGKYDQCRLPNSDEKKKFLS